MVVPERHLADSRANKGICVYDTKDLEYIKAKTCDHDKHDSFDGYDVFQHMIIRAIRHHGKSSAEQEMMEIMAAFHFKRMGNEFFRREMKSLSLVTSIDVSNYGQSLCKPLFRE